MSERRCRICECTEREPCNPPCSWAEDTLCSTCALMIEALRDYFEAVPQLHPRRLTDEARSESFT